MTKHDLLAETTSSRRAFEDELAALSEEQLVKPGVAGDWSARDVLAHVSAWERMFVGDIERLMRDEPPEQGDLWVGEGVDAKNASIFAENRNRPLNDVRADADASHEAFVRLIERLSDDDLFGPQRWRQAYGNAIAPWFRANGPQHYDEHRAQIARFKESL